MILETRRILDTTEPEKLFSKNHIVNEYRTMAKRFHPDKYATGSAILFTKINELYKAGLKKIEDNTWDNNELIMTIPEGKTFKFRYDSKEETEYGQRFISSQHIVLSTHLDSFSSMFKHNVSHCQAYLETRAKLHKNFHQLIPITEPSDFESEAYGDVIVMSRPTPAFHSVQAVLDTNGIIPHRQATWIISRLMNFCVLLNKSGMIHNGITANSVFINVPEHTAALVDGWWYSTKKGTKVKSVPTENVKLLSRTERESKLTTAKFDLECVKQIGRRLEIYDTPVAIKQWLKLPSTDSVLAELVHWQDNVIMAAYGECKFNKWEAYKVPK